jgi:hypothetical protein
MTTAQENTPRAKREHTHNTQETRVQSCARSSSKAVCVLNVNIAPLASVSSLFNCVVVVVNVNGCLTVSHLSRVLFFGLRVQ